MISAKKVSLELKRNGISGVLRKGWHKMCRFLFYSSCSSWYELKLDDSLPKCNARLDFQTEFLKQDKSELIRWLKYYSDRFPWIYCQKEMEFATANEHTFFVMRQNKKIIGYVKIGIGPTYIHDFDSHVVFEPQTAFVYDTFILPDYRGMHLTVFALGKVAGHFREHGFKRILCHIEKWNTPSVKAFTQAGFKGIGSIRYIRVANISFYLYNKYRPFPDLEMVLSSNMVPEPPQPTPELHKST